MTNQPVIEQDELIGQPVAVRGSGRFYTSETRAIERIALETLVGKVNIAVMVGSEQADA